jgi:ATP-dependent DNA helicase RecQ
LDRTAVEKMLRERFGLAAFRDGQLPIIESLLAGRSAAAVFPTGGGKSLCYQLTALLLDGLTLVVSPLMALMREQVSILQSRGIAAVRLDSSLSPDELRTATRSVRSGEAKLLYVAPERFFNERFRELIADIPIGLFAVDEAHCISQWGHNFRPDYLKLSGIARTLKIPRILALTATATPAVLDDICEGFAIARDDVVQTEFHRNNLAIRFTVTDLRARKKQLLERLRRMPSGTMIVYVTFQKTAEEVASWLVEEGFFAKAYHAGLEDDVRQQTQDWFMETPNAIIVATIAFGMGIDKSDIRYIYHWNISKGLESYAQEIGRAGRDGLASHCETFVVPEDRIAIENFAYGDTPTYTSLERLVECISNQPDESYLSYYTLSTEYDIRDLVVRTLLTYLELDGYLESTGPRYDTYEFKPLVASATILDHFEGERRQFASDVLAMSVKRKYWFSIKVAAVTQRLGCERKRLVSMLDYFGEQGWMELKVSGLVHGYRRIRPMDDLVKITESLFDRLSKLEQQELGRIDQLFALVVGKRCQAMRLSEHFGQNMSEGCGTCSSCRGESVGAIPKGEPPRIGTSALTGLAALVKQHPDVLNEPRTRAKFLCGLSSPSLIRSRLSREPLYGCCSEVPFEDVLKAVKGNLR